MIRHAIVLVMCLYSLSQVESAQQQVQLSDSYLPVAMQVIAYITDQMAFDTKDEATPKPTPKPTTRPTTKPTTRPTYWTTTTSRPYVTNGWWTSFTTTTRRTELTTPFHKPGLYQPYTPPKPSDRFSWNQQRFVLLPMEQNSQYTILGPHERRTEEPLLSIHQETIRPLVDKAPGSSPLLPPHHFVKVSSRSDGYTPNDLNEENLQYLADDVKEMIKLAHDPNDDKLVDVWEGIRQGNQPISTKATKLSSSNLRLLLLYDLLSRDAKRQRLSDYAGFSPDVMKNLVESSNGSAREQLRMALSKMVERHDCGHEYANNRAREMVVELGKDESGLSSELRYLQPLIYKY